MRRMTMDMGAKNYRRYLEGDDSGIVAIIDDYREGLILFLNRYVNNIHVAEELAEDTIRSGEVAIWMKREALWYG